MIQFAWHVHHDVLVEPLSGPIENRFANIKKNKPTDEIELRLKLLKPVKGKLPPKIVKAGEAFVKARKAFVKVWEAEAGEAYIKGRKAYIKVREAYDKALADCREEIETLHKEECPDCTWDGKSILA